VPPFFWGTNINKSHFLLAAATFITLCAVPMAFAGEPASGDPTVYGRLNLLLNPIATACP